MGKGGGKEKEEENSTGSKGQVHWRRTRVPRSDLCVDEDTEDNFYFIKSSDSDRRCLRSCSLLMSHRPRKSCRVFNLNTKTVHTILESILIQIWRQQFSLRSHTSARRPMSCVSTLEILYVH